mgnify:CR=1 FL=1
MTEISGSSVFVTGGAGTIGSHIVDQLLDAGHVVDPRPPHLGWQHRAGHDEDELGRGSIRSLMIRRWISLVPSKIVVRRASRQ